MLNMTTAYAEEQTGRVAQSIGHLTRKSEVLGSIPGFVNTYSRGAVVSYWRKYVHEALVNRLGGLSLPRKSMVRLTDRSNMTLDVYPGHKNNNTTTTKMKSNGRAKSVQLPRVFTDCYLLLITPKRIE